MRTYVLVLFLILATMGKLGAQETSARVADAEKVAQQYMTAFYHSDLRTAASLTHAETLRQFQAAFTKERAAAVTAGKQTEFLAQYGLTASTDLDALSPADLYVTVLSGYRRSAPAFADAMKTAAVTVKGSERLDGDRVVVALAITTLASGSTHAQEAQLSLAPEDGRWKVTGNGR